MRNGGIFRIEDINRHWRLHSAEGLYKHLTVLGEVFTATGVRHESAILIISVTISAISSKCSSLVLIIESLVVIVIALTCLLANTETIICILVGTIHIADIAATEHVAVAIEKTLVGANLTAVDVYLSLSEDVAVGVELTLFAQIVVASSAGKGIAVNMSVVHLDARLAALEDGLQLAHGVFLATQLNLATADGGNLATAEDAVADIAAIHKYVGEIDITVVDVTGTEDAAAVQQTVEAHAVGPRLVVNLLLVVFVPVGIGIVSAVGIIDIAYVAVVDFHIGAAIDRTTLAAAIDIALDGRDAVGETGTIQLADDHVRLTQDVVLEGAGYGERHAVERSCGVLAHVALPAATIDVTAHTALDIDVGTGHEAGTVLVGIVTRTHGILHGATGAGGIDVLLHRTAQQGDVGGARHHGVSTKAAAVGVVVDRSSLVNDDVGAIPLMY